MGMRREVSCKDDLEKKERNFLEHRQRLEFTRAHNHEEKWHLYLTLK
jgi:hypothetical protein